MDVRKYDPVIGDYVLRSHGRIKRYSIKVTSRQVIALMPLNGSIKIINQLLEENRAKILRYVEKYEKCQTEKAPKKLDTATKIEGVNYTLNIEVSDRGSFVVKQKSSAVFTILCPTNTDFEDSNHQKILRRAVENVLKYVGKQYLPKRLEELANRNNLSYKRGRVSTSVSRWGSYSSSGTISLSASLMLLPAHLIDFIILHELAHTVHQNHSADFYTLLNQLTEGRERLLNAELKKYTTWRVD